MNGMPAIARATWSKSGMSAHSSTLGTRGRHGRGRVRERDEPSAMRTFRHPIAARR
jgi:hypothetical protein